jgi:hypothetical protein
LVVADNLDAATVKAKSLFDTLDMPQKPDGLRILDQVKRELFVWKPDDRWLRRRPCPGSLLTRGSIRTFRATAETENTASYKGGAWLGDLDSNQD